MGCASSTPMVQTAGSDMLKAATHVADDATKTAEDAVQGVKESLGKSLETAKETVTTTVDELKHDAENTLKEKAEQLDEAKNSLMEKLHLGSNTATEAAASVVTVTKEDVLASKTEAEMAMKSANEAVKQSVEHLNNQSVDAVNEMESVLAQTDTETDSLRTSTPEPEIERAMANTKTNSTGGNGDIDDDDDNDNPPTPVPTFSELENLNNELLTQHSHKAVNDMLAAANNDPLMMMTAETAAAAAAAAAATTITADTTTTTATTTSSTTANGNSSITSSTTSVTTTIDTTKSSAMHITLIPIASATTIASATSIATAIASTTASAMQLGQQDPHSATAKEPVLESQSFAKNKVQKRDVTAEKAMQRNLIQKLKDEKRPGTTEWEKNADILAVFRKYNPHDAFRRGGTLTKFSGHHFGAFPIREKTQFGRAFDDDSSDTTSNRGRGSPALRSSARLGGRIQRPTNRPNSANQRSINDATVRRNSTTTNVGRKFDYNPSRPRLNNGRASNVSSGQNIASKSAYSLTPPNGTHSHSPLQSQMQMQSHSLSPAHKHESVKSPPEMRSQRSNLATNSTEHLQPLHQQQLDQLQFVHKPNYGEPPTLPQLPPPGGSSMPPDAIQSNQHHLPPLTHESSNTSLSSLSPYRGHIRSFKSTYDLTTAHVLHPPARNTSSFLTTPRSSPFSLTKSYTDLYFNSSSNKENNATFQKDLSSRAQQRHVRDKSPYKIRERCEVCCKKYRIKT